MWVEHLISQSKYKYVSAYSIATIYARLGDKEGVFESLEKAYRDRAVELIDIRVEPVFDFIRSDPRFVDLLRRMGLPR